MLRVAHSLRAYGRACSLPGCLGGQRWLSEYSAEHVLVTEQEQGHILEKLQDPEEVHRVLLAMKHRPPGGEVMADTILREKLEAQAAELVRRMDEEEQPPQELCEHGHAHDVCCGASKGEVDEGAE